MHGYLIAKYTGPTVSSTAEMKG